MDVCIGIFDAQMDSIIDKQARDRSLTALLLTCPERPIL
jgi:hypothetical protein